MPGKQTAATGSIVYCCLACLLVMGITGLLALISAQPMLFPSLGPTIIACIQQPMATGSAPRNVLFAHTGGLVAGWLSLVLFGLAGDASAITLGVHAPRVAAAAVSLALTVLFMRLARAPHPPAGATTLIVSLGFLTTPSDLGFMLLAIVWTMIVAWLFNRVMRIPMPLWAPRRSTDLGRDSDSR